MVKGSVYYNDSFTSYNDLDKFGQHLTINHQEIFVDKQNKQNNINRIEGFWSFTKERMTKYNGVKSENFQSYVKGIEFKYHYRKACVCENILQIYYEGILH